MADGIFEELMSRFRDPVSAETEDAKKRIAAEAPDINTTPVQSYGFLSRLLLPQADAYVDPFGTIRVNEEKQKRENQDPEMRADTLLHELTHVRQKNARSPIENILEYFRQRGPYGQRPDEMEAFQVEADRRTRMGRPAAFGTPHFLDNSQETRGDVALHPRYPMNRR